MKRIVLYLCTALVWFATLPVVVAQQAKKSSCTVNVATFNLRMDTPKDGVNAWSNRKEMVKGLIRFHDFDIFGTKQTALKYWIKETSGSLKRQIFQEKAGMLFAVTVSVLGENSEIR